MMKLMNDKKSIHVSVSKMKGIAASVLLFFTTASAFAQSDIIPSEIKTTFETLRDWIKDEIAPVLLGIFWICMAIYYGYHKDSNRAKTAFIAVTIAAIAIGIGIKIVEKGMKLS
ncbi:hypothetical protein [Treponema socranskii]|uniref:hypothetical protein n=1 Tax=Treponema socranskii TaxID=53419 RepID=UPI003D9039C1